MKASAKGYNSESDVKGKPAPVDGLYHATITYVNDSRVKKDGSPLNSTIVEFEVLAGSVPGQEGKTATQFYWLEEDGTESADYCEKVSRLCMAAGILKAGEEKDIDAADLENCQVVIKVHNYVKKDKTNGCGLGDYGLGVWGINNPDVASVPRNHDAIRLWNEARGVSAGISDAVGMLTNSGRNSNGNGQTPGGAGVNTDDI